MYNNIVLKDKLRHILKIFSMFEQKLIQIAASNRADRKELQGAVQNERLTGRKGWEQGSYTRQKSGLVIAKLLSFRGWWQVT